MVDDSPNIVDKVLMVPIIQFKENNVHDLSIREVQPNLSVQQLPQSI